uniref:Uncharacterized protein n=1 Tax=Anopheles culicifacies TaxID=139723 RepID=A0A182MQH3_9DIPT
MPSCSRKQSETIFHLSPWAVIINVCWNGFAGFSWNFTVPETCMTKVSWVDTASSTMGCASIVMTIKTDQNLPDYACKICSAMVWQFYTFSVLVEDNQQKLQQECNLLNAETSKSLSEDYRIGENSHVTVKNEPIDSSPTPTDVPSCQSNQ